MSSNALYASALAIVLAPFVPAQSGWSAPVLEPTLNSSFADTGPHLSLDGLTLHFGANVTGGASYEIYVTTRATPSSPWAAPLLVSVSDSTVVDDQPFLSPNGLELYFGSTNRPGGTPPSPNPNIDIWKATRSNTSAPWSVPVNVTELNGTGNESSFSMTADGLECYFLSSSWNNPASTSLNIVRATRLATVLPWSTPTVVTELLSTLSHRDCEISVDGLSIAYTEPVGTPSRLEVLIAERTSRSLPFGTPVVQTGFAGVGTGIFSFTRAVTGGEAYLAASFPAASGSQELMSTKFEGLCHSGIAGTAGAMTLSYRDTPSSGLLYVIGAALGNTGFMLGTRHVPLDADFLLVGTLGVSVPPWTSGWSGLLNGSGQGNGFVGNPGGLLTGFQVYVGAFTFDATAPQGVRTISNSFPVLLQ